MLLLLLYIFTQKNEQFENTKNIEISLNEGDIEKKVNLDNTPVHLYIFFNRSVYVSGENVIIPRNGDPIILENLGEKFIELSIENEHKIDLQDIGLYIYDNDKYIYGEEIVKLNNIISYSKKENKITMTFNKNIYVDNIIRLHINTKGITKITVTLKQNNFANTKEILNSESSNIRIKKIELTNNIICPSKRCNLYIENQNQKQ